jgi:hypothetical protein
MNPDPCVQIPQQIFQYNLRVVGRVEKAEGIFVAKLVLSFTNLIPGNQNKNVKKAD